jgi:eukaryotic-like serine/threonine-protein kinase
MADDFTGKLIDRKYRLLSELGRGAMGVVYRAEQLDAEGRVRRIVAVKTLKPELSKDLDFARRFLREIGVSMQLRSPHVLTVYDSGKDEDGQLYYVLEFMPQTLKEFLQEHSPLPVAHAVAIVGQICEALAEAHSLPEPVIHRDLKPANIFIEKRQGREVVKIGDFGIAKVLSDHTTGITHTGQASPGTPRYMAPERWLGETVDGRTDLYALGVMLYEMLNGQPPFAGSIPVLMGQHLQLPPPPLSETIPVGVRKELERLLAKTREERPSDASRVRDVLQAALVEEQATYLFQKRETLLPKEEGIAAKVSPQDREARKEKPASSVTNDRPEKFVSADADIESRQRTFPWRIALAVITLAIAGGLLFFFRPQGNETPQSKTEVKGEEVQPVGTPEPLVSASTKPEGKMKLEDEMVLVPAGEFFMGCNEKVDKACGDDEKPGRTVYFDAFKIDKTEVTVAEYSECVQAGKCSVPETGVVCNWQQAGKDNHPINCVDWNQAVAFCLRDGNKRLPTEAEWEKAARGTDGRVWPWGNRWGAEKANTSAEGDGFEVATPVGSFPAGASPYGTLDMAGNVWEWTQDWCDEKYYQSGPVRNSRGVEKGDSKVMRGGAWTDHPLGARASTRFKYAPGLRREFMGMRCAQ